MLLAHLGPHRERRLGKQRGWHYPLSMGEWTEGEISRRKEKKNACACIFTVLWKHPRKSGYCFHKTPRMNECCSGAAMCSSHISYVKHTVNPYSTVWLCYRFIMRATISSLSALDVCVARRLHSHSSKKQVFGERSADVYRKTFHMKKKKKKTICQLVIQTSL